MESDRKGPAHLKDLENFRREWKLELGLNSADSPQATPSALTSEVTDRTSRGTSSSSLEKTVDEEDELEDDGENVIPEEEEAEDKDSIETQAHNFFHQGVNFERTGHFYDAIKFYKKALALVPDIEYKFTKQQGNYSSQQEDQDSSHKTGGISFRDDGTEEVDEEEEEEEETDLKLRFLCDIQTNGWSWFQKARPDTRAHFVDLPEEAIKYVLRWIVSSDLDTRSLDVLSCVSKGFYVVCRDEQLWLRICKRIWRECEAIGLEEYSTYREMFLTRPRVRFDGCYISKTTYIRQGENSFQDHSYRPWHLVEYYRYMFFTPYNQFFFLTTSEPPLVTIPALRDPLSQTKFNNLLVGHYTMEDNLVHGECWNPQKIRGYNNSHNKSGGNASTGNVTYNIVLKILNLRQRFNNGLAWQEYFLNIEGSAGIMKNDVDMDQSKFPNFVFSRVKSFTKDAHKALM